MAAQPQHTSDGALRTRKRHQQEHRPQRPTERSDPTQHAKGRTGDCSGPRKGTTTRRTVTQGGTGLTLGGGITKGAGGSTRDAPTGLPQYRRAWTHPHPMPSPPLCHRPLLFEVMCLWAAAIQWLLGRSTAGPPHPFGLAQPSSGLPPPQPPRPSAAAAVRSGHAHGRPALFLTPLFWTELLSTAVGRVVVPAGHAFGRGARISMRGGWRWRRAGHKPGGGGVEDPPRAEGERPAGPRLRFAARALGAARAPAAAAAVARGMPGDGFVPDSGVEEGDPIGSFTHAPPSPLSRRAMLRTVSRFRNFP